MGLSLIVNVTSFSLTRDMLSLLTTHIVWHSFELLSACSVHFGNWRSTADRCAALLIRIRIVILSAARFARSPSQHFIHGVTQWSAVLYIVARAKEASEASGLSIFYTPMGELIGILYKI